MLVLADLLQDRGESLGEPLALWARAPAGDSPRSLRAAARVIDAAEDLRLSVRAADLAIRRRNWRTSKALDLGQLAPVAECLHRYGDLGRLS